jgi:hypothetical protein
LPIKGWTAPARNTLTTRSTVAWSTCLYTSMQFYVGRLRPDWFGRCELSADIPLDTPLYGSQYCTTTDLHELHEGHLSFPSGHTSFAFCQGVEDHCHVGGHFIYIDIEILLSANWAPARLRRRYRELLIRSTQPSCSLRGVPVDLLQHNPNANPSLYGVRKTEPLVNVRTVVWMLSYAIFFITWACCLLQECMWRCIWCGASTSGRSRRTR